MQVGDVAILETLEKIATKAAADHGKNYNLVIDSMRQQISELDCRTRDMLISTINILLSDDPIDHGRSGPLDS